MPAAGDLSAALVQTPVQTSAYTAKPFEFVRTDTSGGSLTVTLPLAPAANTTIGIKQVATSGSSTTTVACSGSDVLNKYGGATTMVLTLSGQGATVAYRSGVWLIVSDDLPLAQLDTRYAATAGGTLTGPLTVPSINGGGTAPTVAGVTHCVSSAPAGHDLGGSFVLTTDGTGLASAGTMATVTFGNTYSAAPVAVLISVADTTSTITNVTTVIASVSATAITIKNTAATTASHTFLVTYVTIVS
jgi:hypothetical protein